MISTGTQKNIANLRRKYYSWFYELIYSRLYDFGVGLFLRHFGGEVYFRKELMNGINFDGNGKILDLCCGTGGVTLAMLQEQGTTTRIIGLDRSSAQITRAIRKNALKSVSFIVSEASATGLPSGYFDKIFIGHALHEMPVGIRLAVLNEAKRLLHDDGQLILFEFNKPSSLVRRMWLGFWLGSWIPYPINFEKSTMIDMLERGLDNEVQGVGFRDIHKVTKFNDTIQIVTASK